MGMGINILKSKLLPGHSGWKTEVQGHPESVVGLPQKSQRPTPVSGCLVTHDSLLGSRGRPHLTLRFPEPYSGV